MDDETILQHGQIDIKGEFLWGSNYTFLAEVKHSAANIFAVYKPSRGERPLWDFPAASLAHREAAAYLVSQSLGWDFVPPTVYRDQAPMGPGSLQSFIKHDPEYHYFNFNQSDLQRLRPVVAFDLLINNADRKGSHILIDESNKLWLIDHGLSFHEQEKLRTVLWDFVGETLPEKICEDLSRLYSDLTVPSGNETDLFTKLLAHLSSSEVKALAVRAEKLVLNGSFPAPDPERRPFPWPQI